MKGGQKVYKFQRIASGGIYFVEHLYIEDRYIGLFGQDDDGLYVKSNQLLTLNEINLLIAQLSKANPSLLDKPVKFLQFKSK